MLWYSITMFNVSPICCTVNQDSINKVVLASFITLNFVNVIREVAPYFLLQIVKFRDSIMFHVGNIWSKSSSITLITHVVSHRPFYSTFTQISIFTLLQSTVTSIWLARQTLYILLTCYIGLCFMLTWVKISLTGNSFWQLSVSSVLMKWMRR